MNATATLLAALIDPEEDTTARELSMTASSDRTRPGGRAPAAGRWAAAIVDVLDQGLVVCDAALDRLHFANQSARRALAAFDADDVRPRVPAAWRAALREADGGARLSTRFTGAVDVEAPTGHHFFLRARRLLATGEVLLVVTAARLRHAELVELLQRRLRLTRRQSQCVALIRSGLPNREIATRLRVTVGTVSQYLVAIFQRLHVQRRAEVVALVDEVAYTAEVPRRTAGGHSG